MRLGSNLLLPRQFMAGLYLLISFFFSTGFGQDRATSAVEKALERVERALEREEALAPETKDALRDLIQALRMERGWDPRPTQGVQETRAAVSKSEITKVVDSHLADRIDPPQEPAWKEVLSRLTFYGDLRLRHESSFRLDGKPARHRERVRFRFGANYQLSNEVLLGGRITTGNPADPQSPHVTLGNVFHSFDMTLDRAFLNYRPTWMPEVDLTAGKFSHPFTINPVYSELVWDADVQPEGFVGRYSISEAGRLERLDFLAGAYILLEQGTAEDTLASVFQLSSGFRLADQLRTNLALGYYRYADATPEGSLSIFKENSGNAVVDTDGDGKPDDFQSRFGIL
ncbi:MAG: putative porin, partial [Acidobacteriota bacterium]